MCAEQPLFKPGPIKTSCNQVIARDGTDMSAGTGANEMMTLNTLSYSHLSTN